MIRGTLQLKFKYQKASLKVQNLLNKTNRGWLPKFDIKAGRNFTHLAWQFIQVVLRAFLYMRQTRWAWVMTALGTPWDIFGPEKIEGRFKKMVELKYRRLVNTNLAIVLRSNQGKRQCDLMRLFECDVTNILTLQSTQTYLVTTMTTD